MLNATVTPVSDAVLSNNAWLVNSVDCGCQADRRIIGEVTDVHCRIAENTGAVLRQGMFAHGDRIAGAVPTILYAQLAVIVEQTARLRRPPFGTARGVGDHITHAK